METLTYDKPTCFIMGRQDHAVGYTDGLPYLQQFSRVTYAVLDGAGHNAQFERQPLFEALLQDWLIRAAQSTEPASQTGSHQQ